MTVPGDSYQLSGLVVRVSALKLGGQGSISGHVIPKTLKNGTQCLPAWHSASKVGLRVSPCDILATCPGGVLVHHVQGVYLYVKLPHATETGDRLQPYGPHGSARLTYLLTH